MKSSTLKKEEEAKAKMDAKFKPMYLALEKSKIFKKDLTDNLWFEILDYLNVVNILKYE